MEASWLARRAALHRPPSMLWLALAVPAFVTGRFLYESHRAVAEPTLLGTLLAGGAVYVVARMALEKTLVGWQSRHLLTLTQVWTGYAALTVLVFLAQTGSRLFAAEEAGQVLHLTASVRLPLAEVAPAVLLGPFLWAVARDAYALIGHTQGAALRSGVFALVVLLLLPIVAYLAGAWWADQSWLPHFTTFVGFRRMIVALFTAVLGAAVLAWFGIVLDLRRARRLEEEVAV